MHSMPYKTLWKRPMTSDVPGTSGLLPNRKLVWLARGAALALVALFVALNVCDVTAVKSVSDCQRTVYSGSHLLSIFVGCFGLVIFVFGIFFWRIRVDSVKRSAWSCFCCRC